MKNNLMIVLALYPNQQGLGYACLEIPNRALDSGVVTVRPLCNRKILKRIKKFLDFFKPKIVMLRDCDAANSLRSKRLMQLMADISKYADEKQIPVYRYTRQQIRDVFELFGARSKYEIAQQIIKCLPDLAAYAPKIRKPWMNEDYNMGIFDALSLAITHEYLSE